MSEEAWGSLVDAEHSAEEAFQGLMRELGVAEGALLALVDALLFTTSKPDEDDEDFEEQLAEHIISMEDYERVYEETIRGSTKNSI